MFSRGPPWRPSWISNRIDLSYFDLQVTGMLPTKFRVSWPFGSGEEAKIDFQDGRHGDHLGFPSLPDASNQVSSQLAQGCRRSRLLKELLTTDDAQRTLTDRNSSS